MGNERDQLVLEVIAADAYQVIGSLAYSCGVFDDSAVVRALDYFSSVADGEEVDEILPWELSRDNDRLGWGLDFIDSKIEEYQKSDDPVIVKVIEDYRELRVILGGVKDGGFEDEGIEFSF